MSRKRLYIRAVDAVEEEHPARRDERGRRERRRPPGEARARGAPSTGTLATAKSAEKRRSAGQAAAEVRDEPGEEKWSGAPPRSVVHGLEQPAERLAADEERERLVLVRRPGGQPREQEDGDGAACSR